MHPSAHAPQGPATAPGAASRPGSRQVPAAAPAPAKGPAPAACCREHHAAAASIASPQTTCDGATTAAAPDPRPTHSEGATATAPNGIVHARFARDTALHYKACANKAASSACAARLDIYLHTQNVCEFIELHPGPLGVAKHDLGWDLVTQLCSAPGFNPPGRLKSARIDAACGSAEVPIPLMSSAGAHPAPPEAAFSAQAAAAAAAPASAAGRRRAQRQAALAKPREAHATLETAPGSAPTTLSRTTPAGASGVAEVLSARAVAVGAVTTTGPRAEEAAAASEFADAVT